MLDIHQLNVFLIAGQTLNFSETARRLHMSQPSVSQHIQTLEQHFGVKLFIRRGRHLQLSEAGETLIPLARELVNYSNLTEETMASLQGIVHGHLIIGCCTTAGRFVLPRLLARFRERHTNVQVTCHVTDQRTALTMLNDGKLHLVVASNREVAKDAEFLNFIQDPVLLVAYPEHPWAQQKLIEPEQLLEQEFIFREEGSGTRRAVEEALPSVGLYLDQLRIIMVLGTSSAISLSVQEKIGVAFITRLAVQKALEAGELVEIKVRGLAMSQNVWIGRNNHFPTTKPQLEFWKFILDPENEVLKNLRRIEDPPADLIHLAATEGKTR